MLSDSAGAGGRKEVFHDLQLLQLKQRQREIEEQSRLRLDRLRDTDDEMSARGDAGRRGRAASRGYSLPGFCPSKAPKAALASVAAYLQSPEEIIAQSVCEITSDGIHAWEGEKGTINDCALGPTNRFVRCRTCGGRYGQDCPGHPAHFTLGKPLLHPLMHKKVPQAVTCVCWNCKQLLLPEVDPQYALIAGIADPADRLASNAYVCKSIRECRGRRGIVAEARPPRDAKAASDIARGVTAPILSAHAASSFSIDNALRPEYGCGAIQRVVGRNGSHILMYERLESKRRPKKKEPADRAKTKRKTKAEAAPEVEAHRSPAAKREPRAKPPGRSPRAASSTSNSSSDSDEGQGGHTTDDEESGRESDGEETRSAVGASTRRRSRRLRPGTGGGDDDDDEAGDEERESDSTAIEDDGDDEDEEEEDRHSNKLADENVAMLDDVDEDDDEGGSGGRSGHLEFEDEDQPEQEEQEEHDGGADADHESADEAGGGGARRRQAKGRPQPRRGRGGGRAEEDDDRASVGSAAEAAPLEAAAATGAAVMALVEAASAPGKKLKHGPAIPWDMEKTHEILKGIHKDSYFMLGVDPEEMDLANCMMTVFPVPPASVRSNGTPSSGPHGSGGAGKGKGGGSGGTAAKKKTPGQTKNPLDKHIQALFKCAREMKSLQRTISNDESRQDEVSDALARQTVVWDKAQRLLDAYIDKDRPGKSGAAPSRYVKVVIRSMTIRMVGKRGTMRDRLASRRVNYCGRTVIVPSPDLDFDEIAVPEFIAIRVTYPERVNPLNRAMLERMVLRGPFAHPGATVVARRHGGTVDLAHIQDRRTVRLNDGDLVYRHLVDGDVVLANRQPSLHKQSLMSHRIRVWKQLAMGIHLSTTTPYNADFDGDEMNLHVPQSPEARAEAVCLMQCSDLVMDNQGKACEALVQDSLIGSDQSSRRGVFMDRATFYQAVYQAGGDRPDAAEADEAGRDLAAYACATEPAVRARDPDTGRWVELFTGKQLFGAVATRGLAHSTVRVGRGERPWAAEEAERVMADEAVVISAEGELLVGRLTKSVVGVGRGGYVQKLAQECGADSVRVFLSRATRLYTRWLYELGFGMGAGNCDTLSHRDEIRKVVRRSVGGLRRREHLASGGSGGTVADRDDEDFTCRVLSAVVQHCGALVLRDSAASAGAGRARNNAAEMVRAGVKGNNTNIVGPRVMMGQIKIQAKRVELAYGTRPLPHFAPGDAGPVALAFVLRGLIEGLSPTSAFYHAAGGREGLVDTVNKTAPIGYIQRRLIKALENLLVLYNLLVCDHLGIVSFAYGEDGFAASKLVKIRHPMLWNGDDDVRLELDLRGVPEHLQCGLSLPGSDAQVGSTAEGELSRLLRDRGVMRERRLRADPANLLPDVLSPVDFEVLLSRAKNLGPDAAKRAPPSASSKAVKLLGELLAAAAAALPPLQQQLGDAAAPDDEADRVERERRLWDTPLNDACAVVRVLEVALAEQLATYRFGTFPSGYVACWRVFLCARRLVTGQPSADVTWLQFSWLLRELDRRFHGALASPGEMVGVTAGQMIGEPAMQMTLQTFHHAGVGLANMSLGIPRLVAIIETSRRPESRVTRVCLLPAFQCLSGVRTLCQQFLAVRVRDVVRSLRIGLEPDVSRVPAEDEELLPRWHHSRVAPDLPAVARSLSPLVVRIVLDRDRLLRSGRAVDDVVWALKASLPGKGGLAHVWAWTPSFRSQWVIRLRLRTSSDEYTKRKRERALGRKRLTELADEAAAAAAGQTTAPASTRSHDLTDFETTALLLECALDALVQGIKGTTSATGCVENRIVVDPVTGAARRTQEPVIYVVGGSLREVLAVPGVDTTRSTTDSVMDVEECFGIAAATAAVLAETERVFQSNGSYVDHRAVHLMAMAMARTGRLVPFTRHGFNKDPRLGFLKKMAFEKSVDWLRTAAFSGMKDNLNDVLSNIIVGTEPRIGTNTVELLPDRRPLASAAPRQQRGASLYVSQGLTAHELRALLPAECTAYLLPGAATPPQRRRNAAGIATPVTVGRSAYSGEPAPSTRPAKRSRTTEETEGPARTKRARTDTEAGGGGSKKTRKRPRAGEEAQAATSNKRRRFEPTSHFERLRDEWEESVELLEPLAPLNVGYRPLAASVDSLAFCPATSGAVARQARVRRRPLWLR